MAKRKPVKPKAPNEVAELSIELLGSEPPIWRRFAVPFDLSLSDLHDVIQIVMGWTNSHMHQFVTPDEVRYGRPDLAGVGDERDERRATLKQIASKKGGRFVYEYDFGDGWEHGLKVERIGPPTQGTRYPLLLEGERACPPDDVGGVYGYEEFLEAIKDPKHESHDDLLDWIGGSFDPEEFDVDKVNRELRKLKLS
jgi:hypothetical protein